MTHDVVLIRKDGSVRNFRVYDRPTPHRGDTITLPVDGRLIEARVVGESSESLRQPELVQSANRSDATDI
jgi:hypothetical protein